MVLAAFILFFCLDVHADVKELYDLGIVYIFFRLMLLYHE